MRGAGRVHPDRPALVYLLRQSPREAATASLLVMGIGAVTVAITHARAGRARLRTGAVSGHGTLSPGWALVAAFTGRL